MNFLYQLPNWALCLTIVSGFTLLSVLGGLVTRPWISLFQPSDNETVAHFLSATGTIYAVLLAMVAVASWNSYVETDALVAREAGLTADLFRDLEAYPRPARDELRQLVYDYVTTVVEIEWPAVREGRVEKRADLAMNAMFEGWQGFVPEGDLQRTAHARALDRLNELFNTRESRLQKGTSGIMPSLWLVVIAGFLLNIGMTYLLHLSNRRLHCLLTGGLGMMFGLVIYLIAAMDYPLWGEISIPPDAFRQVQVLMERRLHPATPGEKRLAQAQALAPAAPFHSGSPPPG